VKTDLVLLAALMGAATYPWRAVPLLAPGIHRLPPPVLAYLRLVGPAVLAALAAINTFVALDPARHAAFHVGADWLAVGLCLLIVVRWKNLLLGLVLAAALLALIRAMAVAG
jgi:branched-subunit amino acid transport protein